MSQISMHWRATSIPILLVLLFVTLACSVNTPIARISAKVQPGSVPTASSSFRIQNANWQERTLVGIVKDQKTGSLVYPVINGIPTKVQSTDDFPATYDATSQAYVIMLPSTIAVGSVRNLQVKANGYIAATGKVTLNSGGPTYVVARIVPVATRAGGTLSSITVANIAGLSVSPAETTIDTNKTLDLTVTGTLTDGSTVIDPPVAVSVSSSGGDGSVSVTPAGSYQFQTGTQTMTYTVTFGSVPAQTQAIVHVKAPAWSQVFFTANGITGRSADSTGAATWSPDENKMFVWAFHTASGQAAELWAYSPSTNSWQQRSNGGISPRGAPIVYDSTNSKIYLYGGWNGFTNFNDLWEYTPSTDTWQQHTFTGGITGRRTHTMVWDPVNQRMYVFGGQTGESWSYEPIGKSWTQITASPAPSSRTEHMAAWDSTNNKMYVYGGEGLNDLWVYTPSGPTSGTWSQLTATGITARNQGVMVWNPIQQKLHICGGQTGGTFTNECWSYTPTGDTWSQITTVPGGLTARVDSYAVWDTLNNRMLWYGGGNGGNPNTGTNLFNDLWSFGT